MKSIKFTLKSPPKIDGLSFRKFAGEIDFPDMLKIVEAVAKADHQETSDTLADLKHNYTHLTNCDPEQDMIFAEVNGEPVAYSRVSWWQEEDPLCRIYCYFVNIHPVWREKGIETALITWCEARLKEIADSHPLDIPRFFQIESNEFKPDFNDLLASLGYAPVRYFIEMVRSLEDFPSAELPPDVDVRPVAKDQERKVWEASCEAFRDHWGFAKQDDKHYQRYISSKYFQPELWQVAWNGDTVVASVLNYIDHDYNEKNQRLRGWTEDISTHRAWRKRGLARALIVRSMHMHKALGMTEVGLGVDTDSPTGAQKLYQNLGYQKEKTFITYRKPMQ